MWGKLIGEHILIKAGKSQTIRIILIILEVLSALAFVISFRSFNTGNAAGFLISVFLLLITAFWNKTGRFRKSTVGKAITVFVAAFLIACFCYAGFLSFKMVRSCLNHLDNPNMVVVLGCQLWGEDPSPMLQKRLDKAYELLEQYPDIPVVVTGGQGDDEVISEGKAMKMYLLKRGISEDRIIVEDKSTSTYENIRNAFEITDSMGYSRDITVVTSEYHIFRAELIARSLGSGEITSYPSHTDIYLLPAYWVREWLAISHYIVFGN